MTDSPFDKGSKLPGLPVSEEFQFSIKDEPVHVHHVPQEKAKGVTDKALLVF